MQVGSFPLLLGRHGRYVTIAMSGVPLFKTDVLLKTPVVRTFELSWS